MSGHESMSVDAKNAIECLRRASEAMTQANAAIRSAEVQLDKIGFASLKGGEKITDLMLYHRRTHAQLAFHMGVAEVAIRRAETLRRLGRK